MSMKSFYLSGLTQILVKTANPAASSLSKGKQSLIIGSQIKNPESLGDSGFKKIFRQRPTLPLSLPSSTIGAKERNFRVRDGNGCFLFAIATEKTCYLTV